jgi:hypothetical protein
MLGTVLLPELRVSKKGTLGCIPPRCEGLKNGKAYITTKERLKKRVGVNVFKGMTEKERTILKKQGIL